MKNILFCVCVGLVVVCLFCFSAAVFGGPLMLAYKLVTIKQLLVTIAVCLGVGFTSASVISRMD